MNIENKVVVVTGAASGIGRALAQAFKNARADKVYIADLNEEGLAETADLMDGIAIKTDVSKESEIKSLVEEVNKENDIETNNNKIDVNDVEEKTFSVSIIPHTSEITTLGNIQKNDIVNIEIDILARYIDNNIKK